MLLEVRGGHHIVQKFSSSCAIERRRLKRTEQCAFSDKLTVVVFIGDSERNNSFWNRHSITRCKSFQLSSLKPICCCRVYWRRVKHRISESGVYIRVSRYRSVACYANQRPPLISMISPVMKLAPGAARNTAAAEHSSGPPLRLRGVLAAMVFMASSVVYLR
jgi:hypothetical protein